MGTMNKRDLGRSGLSIGPLVLGGNVFGWTTDEARSFQVLDGFIDAGFNLVDTADVYSRWASGNKGGESETVIGNWLKKSGKRNRVLIASKVGKEMGPGKKGLSAKYMTGALHDSLNRLQTDHIDLYQAHEDDPHTPLEESLEAFSQWIKAGKIRAIGASNFTAARLEAALSVSELHKIPRYECLQPQYNLCERSGFENELQPICEKNQVGVIVYYALASGFLTGKYRSVADLGKSARGQGIRKYLNGRGFRILGALDEVSARYQSAPATIALAWLMQRPGVTAPIASATSPEQLQELVRAADLQLEPAAVALLDQASA